MLNAERTLNVMMVILTPKTDACILIIATLNVNLQLIAAMEGVMVMKAAIPALLTVIAGLTAVMGIAIQARTALVVTARVLLAIPA